MYVITHEKAANELSPIFKGWKGKLLYKIGLKLTGVDHVNETHNRVGEAGIPDGPEFAKGILDDVGIDFKIGHADRLNKLPEGPFIAIANHIYGHVDGICLVDLLGHVRPKTKVMVNEFLMWIKGLTPNFISVNPSLGIKGGATSTSINGVKAALLNLREGEPLALFPSGAVADLKPSRGWTLEEREWQEAAIKLIRKAKVPVIPIYIHGHNSWISLVLGAISWKLRTLRLPSEMFRRKSYDFRVSVHDPIMPEQYAQYKTPEELGVFLKNETYKMKKWQQK